MNNCLKITALLMILVFVCNFAQSTDKPLTSKGDIQFYVDKVSFKGKDEKKYVEFYLMVFADQIELSDNRNKAVLNISALIKDAQGKTATKREWVTEAAFREIMDIRTLAVYDEWGEMLASGNYKIEVEVVDNNSGRKGISYGEISIPEFAEDVLSISEIKFFNGMAESDKKSSGSNSLLLNPARRFGILNPVLYFYFEVYSDSTFSQNDVYAGYKITDINGSTVKLLDNSRLNLAGRSISFSQAISVANVPTGIYNFHITLQDESSTSLAASSRMFEVIQKDYLEMLSPSIGAEELSVLENLLGYLAIPSQMNAYEQLNETGKTVYLINFFKELDKKPITLENEYLIELIQRYNEANSSFSWGKVEGWSTDRGRILIQNGKPDDIEYFHFETGFKPYDKWYYRGERELYYIFADIYSNGNYILVHSNYEGDIFNPNWRELVRGF